MAEEDVAEKSEKAGLGDKVKDLITKIKSSKKMMIIAGSGALLILLIIGGATYYLLSSDEPSEEVVIDDTDKEFEETADKEEIAKIKDYSNSDVTICHVKNVKRVILIEKMKAICKFHSIMW